MYIYRVVFYWSAQKRLSVKPLGNSDTWNFFDGIYYVILTLRTYKGGTIKKTTLYIFGNGGVLGTSEQLSPETQPLRDVLDSKMAKTNSKIQVTELDVS